MHAKLTLRHYTGLGVYPPPPGSPLRLDFGSCGSLDTVAKDRGWENGQKLYLTDQEPSPWRNPLPAVDILIVYPDHRIVLIQRKNPPFGWAIPGGFVNEGESLCDAAVREAREETSLDVIPVEQFFTYSNPKRDPRRHVLSTVFIAHPKDPAKKPVAADDATNIRFWSVEEDPSKLPLVFDHATIANDYRLWFRTGKRPGPHL